MTSHVGSGGQVRYFHCPSCQRWTTSVYTEVFRADTKMRTHARRPLEAVKSSFEGVKDRLDRWLRSLDDQDPYRALGCSPMDSEQTIRERYRALAKQHHPDRGGRVDDMRRINDAYERVLSHREQKKRREQLSAGPVGNVELPTGA